MELAQGGTAVGTGLNAPIGFDKMVAERIAAITGLLLHHRASTNSLRPWPPMTPWSSAHGAINTVAASLFKIANDIRLLGFEARVRAWANWPLLENEPGSSIMPGKVNPTQCGGPRPRPASRSSATMRALTFAGSQGHFELNVCNPVMAYNSLQSVQPDGRCGGKLHRQLRQWASSRGWTISGRLERVADAGDGAGAQDRP